MDFLCLCLVFGISGISVSEHALLMTWQADILLCRLLVAATVNAAIVYVCSVIRLSSIYPQNTLQWGSTQLVDNCRRNDCKLRVLLVTKYQIQYHMSHLTLPT